MTRRERQVKLSVPDHLAPRKIKFIVFRKDKVCRPVPCVYVEARVGWAEGGTVGRGEGAPCGALSRKARSLQGETGAAFWFKSHGEGEFEVYVCPDAWRLDIEKKRKCVPPRPPPALPPPDGARSRASKGGLVESIFGRKTAKPPAAVERIPSETTEDQIDPAPVPEEPWHFNKEKAKVRATPREPAPPAPAGRGAERRAGPRC